MHVSVDEARQDAAVLALDRAGASICEGFPEDFWTIDLMEAYRSLGSMIGEEVGDDVVEEIFSKFCVGK